jgi:hypothetical protein
MDVIESILFINLDQRTDRLEHLNQQLEEWEGLPKDRVVRISAIPEGGVGCLKSHILALQHAKQKQWSNVLILEDDFTLAESPSVINAKLMDFWQKHHHEFGWVQLVSLLNHSEPLEGEPVHKVINASNAAGYWVHARCYDALIDVLQKAVEPLASTGKHWLYINDVVWNSLRTTFPTYAFVPRLGYQYANYSNLRNDFVPEQ